MKAAKAAGNVPRFSPPQKNSEQFAQKIFPTSVVLFGIGKIENTIETSSLTKIRPVVSLRAF
jgi:hypothetical protein